MSSCGLGTETVMTFVLRTCSVLIVYDLDALTVPQRRFETAQQHLRYSQSSVEGNADALTAFVGSSIAPALVSWISGDPFCVHSKLARLDCKRCG